MHHVLDLMLFHTKYTNNVHKFVNFSAISCSCLKHSVVPLQWRYTMEHYIPKTKPPSPSNIKDFNPIALLNVEGKLFFSLISKLLVKHNNQQQPYQLICPKRLYGQSSRLVGTYVNGVVCLKGGPIHKIFFSKHLA